MGLAMGAFSGVKMMATLGVAGCGYEVVDGRSYSAGKLAELGVFWLRRLVPAGVHGVVACLIAGSSDSRGSLVCLGQSPCGGEKLMVSDSL